jgi:hypothetical protein
MQDTERLFAINLPQLLLGVVVPDSRNTSSCDVPEPFSLRAASTSARSCSVSGSSSSGAVIIDCHTGSASARRILRVAGRSPAGM